MANVEPTQVGPSGFVNGLRVFDPISEQPGGYSVVGNRYPIFTKMLEPDQKICGEPGAMLMMGPDIKMQTGLAGKGVMGALKGAVGGELLKNTFTNSGSEPQMVSLSGNIPFGSTVFVDTTAMGSVTAKPGLYVGGDESVKISATIIRAKNCGTCCCAGLPPFLQKLSGEGVAFIQGMGTVARKDLAAGEVFLTSTDAIVAYTSDVDLDVRQVGSCATCCFGGEGCFNTQFTGPGTVWVQSFGMEKLMKLMPPKQDSKKQGADSAIGAAL